VILPLLAASLFAQQPVAPKPLVPGAKVITLWPAGHPTLKNTDQEEVFRMAPNQPDRLNSVIDVHNPSIEVHLAPEGKRNGVGMIVAPGGGNTQLVVGGEGIDIAKWLNEMGISAFILRYRLRPYDSTVDAVADTLRSVQTVRANSKEWGVDPNKIGLIGFSAGGEQAAWATLKFADGKPDAADPIERMSSRADFIMLIYPGWRRMQYTDVPANAPPVWITCAGLDDASHARASVAFHNALFDAKVSSELMIYRRGGHGGNIKPRNGIPFGAWPDRMIEWIVDLGIMPKPAQAPR